MKTKIRKHPKRPNQFRGNEAFIGVYGPPRPKHSKAANPSRGGFFVLDCRAGFLGRGNQAQRSARQQGFLAMRS